MAKYLKQDSDLGYVEDSAEIEYLKFNNLRHTILGYMWGDFNSEGEYVISPDIQRELIAIKKYVVDTIDNIDICYSNIKFDKQITFMVTIEGNRAYLSLVEKISFEANNKLNSGTYSNINEYILDEVETSGVIDKNALYRRWNISSIPDNILDIFHMDEETLSVYSALINRFKYLIKSNEILLKNEEKLEEIEAEYSVNLLNLINHYPTLKKVVDNELKSTLNEKKEFVRIDRPNFAKTVNEILDKIIENNINTLNEKEKRDFAVEKHNIQVKRNIQVQDIIEYKCETVEIKEEHLGNEITAERKDKVIIQTNREEEKQSIQELATDNLAIEKEVVERNVEEAIAINTGVVLKDVKDKENDKRDGSTAGIDKDKSKSKIIASVLSRETNDTSEIHNTQVSAQRQNLSQRIALFNELKTRDIEVKDSLGPTTRKRIEEIKKDLTKKQTDKDEVKSVQQTNANDTVENKKKETVKANGSEKKKVDKSSSLKSTSSGGRSAKKNKTTESRTSSPKKNTQTQTQSSTTTDSENKLVERLKQKVSEEKRDLKAQTKQNPSENENLEQEKVEVSLLRDDKYNSLQNVGNRVVVETNEGRTVNIDTNSVNVQTENVNMP